MADISAAGAAPGIVVIQIDGLGHDVLTRAVRHRVMPFTRKLLRRHGYAMVNSRSCVPASTPSFQAGLMYGVANVLPGFRWFEKASGRVRVMKNFADIGVIRGRLPEERGLFRGGAVYCSFFSGGAERAYFTPGQDHPGYLAGPTRLGAVPWLLARNLGPLFRVLGLSVYELWLEFLDWLRALRQGQFRRGEGIFPFERVAANTMLREITSLGVMEEIRRGTPAVYVNFTGFDVMGHHRGPRSFSAALALKAIDHKIRRFWRAAERAARRGGRPYEFYVLSDHGQTPTVPFARTCGLSLREVIVEHELSRAVAQVGGSRYREMVHSVSVLGHLRQLRALLPWPLGALAGLAARRIEHRLGHAAKEEIVECAADTVILPTSGLAHVYFRRHKGRPSLTGVEAEHPGLIAHLTLMPGVRAVVGREDGRTVIRGARGELTVGEKVTVTGEDPLAGAGPTEDIARELSGLLAQEESGDLVVLAGKLERGRQLRFWRGPVYANFLDELGGHGGVEPPEQNTFLIAPAERAKLFPPGCLPHQLYEGLMKVRGTAP